jgi:uncharacterized protein DUF2867
MQATRIAEIRENPGSSKPTAEPGRVRHAGLSWQLSWHGTPKAASPKTVLVTGAYRQRAIFFPKGLSGRLYRPAVLPFHGLIFPAMSRNITAAAKDLQDLESETTGQTP